MKDKLIITVTFDKREDGMFAHYNVNAKRLHNESFLAMMEYSPTLMREFFGMLERGGRYMVDHDIVYREPMRRILEETTSLSIEEIEKYLEMVS